MYLIFYRTNDVFRAEETLNNCNIKTEIVPTPVQDKAYCGVCVKISHDNIEKAERCLMDMDYSTILM